MQKSNKTPVNAETFAEWKSKRLALLNVPLPLYPFVHHFAPYS